MQLGHAVGLRTLPAHDADDVLVQFIGLERMVQFFLRIKYAARRFDDVAAIDQLQIPVAGSDSIASDLKTARDEASAARLLALVGLTTGILGLVVSGVALTRRKG